MTMYNIRIVEREMTPTEWQRVGAGFEEHGLEWGNPARESERCSVVTLAGDQFVGYASGLTSNSGRWLRVTDLFVEEPFLRNGVGPALLSALEARAAAQGVHGIWAWSGEYEWPELYRKIGYKVFWEMNEWSVSGKSRCGFWKRRITGTSPKHTLDSISFIERERTEAEADRIKAGVLEHRLRSGDPPTEPTQYSVVALDGQRFVGCADGRTNDNGRWFYLDNLFVEKRFRRGGLGSKLLAAAEAWAATTGARWIWTWTAGYEAPGFYQKLGYEVFCEMKQWYPSGHARVGLWKSLPHGS